MKKGMIVFACFLFNYSIAQNLISNGNFEDYTSCPTYYGEIALAQSWSSPSYGTPDYYNTCADSASMVGIPNNWSGYQNPQSGEAYAGVAIYYDSPSDMREYMQGELNTPLIQNKCYLFTMYVNVPNRSRYTSNSIGVFFSPTTYPIQTNDKLIQVVPQLNNLTTTFPDSSSWMEISGEYQAIGGEAFFMIGNFNDSASTQLQVSNPDEVLFNSAYLLIDDVSLIPCEMASLDPSQKSKPVTVFPNPCSEELIFTGIGEEANLAIFDNSGRKVLESNITDHQSIRIESLQTGAYFFLVKTSTGEINQGKFVKK